MMSLESPDQDLISRGGMLFAGSVCLFGGGVWMLIKVLKKNEMFKITEETRECFTASSGVALGIWALTITPTFIVRRIGWSNVQYFYREILFQNAYTTMIAIFVPAFLSLYTLLLPSRERKQKATCLAISCASVGVLAAPLFFQPKDFVTVAGFYTASISVPLMVGMSISPDLVWFNSLSTIMMVLSTIFVRNTAIPFVLERRHLDTPVRYIPLLNEFYDKIFIAGTLSTAFFSLIVANAHILYVQKCFAARRAVEPLPVKSVKTGKKGVKTGGKTTTTPKKPLVGTKQAEASLNHSDWFVNANTSKWLVIDGTDIINNGFLISISIVATFFQLLSKSARLTRKLLKKKTAEEKRQEEAKKEGIAERIFSWLIKY